MHLNPAIATLLAGFQHPALPCIDLSLERMRALLAALGNPQDAMPPAIHIAGTNGKGSTLAMLRSVYERAGYRVHAYTSPHLVRFNERIRIAGAEIGDALLLSCLTRVAGAAQQVPATFFEATTAVAMLAFAEQEADLLLLEVGLGGRLDATNLVRDVAASVLTPVGYDHTEFLGTGLGAIAAEKAGILRVGIPCISAVQAPEAAAVIAAQAAALGCDLHEPHPQPPMPAMQGAHQRDNAALAASVVQVLQPRFPVSAAALEEGIRSAHWPARLQRLHYGPLVAAWGARGPVVLDGGHNAHAAAAIAQWLDAQGGEAVLVAGLLRRKDAAAFFAPLAGRVRAVACIPVPGTGDGYSPEALAALVPGAVACADAAEAVARLSHVENATLLVGGSLYLAGAVLENHG